MYDLFQPPCQTGAGMLCGWLSRDQIKSRL